ncbi:hypothetical protein FPL18_09425 [Acinetobacter gyllenbergii]|nr:hypothetical protein FPL18_09425 [Acinetobacter gyllenbergii]
MKKYAYFQCTFLLLIGFLLTSCVSLEAKLMGYDKKTNELLQSMIGRPLDELVAKIGEPRDSRNGLTNPTYVVKDSFQNNLYVWKIQNFARTRYKAVGPTQITSTHVGTRYTQGGAHPVYEDHITTPLREIAEFDTCLVRVFTNAKGIILAKSVKGETQAVGGPALQAYQNTMSGGETKATGGWCDEYLGLKK